MRQSLALDLQPLAALTEVTMFMVLICITERSFSMSLLDAELSMLTMELLVQ